MTFADEDFGTEQERQINWNDEELADSLKKFEQYGEERREGRVTDHAFEVITRWAKDSFGVTDDQSLGMLSWCYDNRALPALLQIPSDASVRVMQGRPDAQQEFVDLNYFLNLIREKIMMAEKSHSDSIGQWLQEWLEKAITEF